MPHTEERIIHTNSESFYTMHFKRRNNWSPGVSALYACMITRGRDTLRKKRRLQCIVVNHKLLYPCTKKE